MLHCDQTVGFLQMEASQILSISHEISEHSIYTGKTSKNMSARRKTINDQHSNKHKSVP